RRGHGFVERAHRASRVFSPAAHGTEHRTRAAIAEVSAARAEKSASVPWPGRSPFRSGTATGRNRLTGEADRPACCVLADCPLGPFLARLGHALAWWLPVPRDFKAALPWHQFCAYGSPQTFVQKGDRAMNRIGVFIYGVLSYAVFFATFLYAVGFVGGFG